MLPGVTLNRDVDAGTHRLGDLVQGLDTSPPLRRLFGSAEACRGVLDAAKVAVDDEWGYMWVSDEDGTLHVALPYWKRAKELYLYLDLVHELVHVKQHHDGRPLYDESFEYVDRPTEVEAYQVTVEEARRLGMDDDELFEFLYVEWCTLDQHARLCGHVGVPVIPGRVPTRAPDEPEAV